MSSLVDFFPFLRFDSTNASKPRSPLGEACSFSVSIKEQNVQSKSKANRIFNYGKITGFSHPPIVASCSPSLYHVSEVVSWVLMSFAVKELAQMAKFKAKSEAKAYCASADEGLLGWIGGVVGVLVLFHGRFGFIKQLGSDSSELLSCLSCPGDSHELEAMQKNCMKFWDGRRPVETFRLTGFVEKRTLKELWMSVFFWEHWHDLLKECDVSQCMNVWLGQEGSTHSPPSHSAGHTEASNCQYTSVLKQLKHLHFSNTFAYFCCNCNLVPVLL